MIQILNDFCVTLPTDDVNNKTKTMEKWRNVSLHLPVLDLLRGFFDRFEYCSTGNFTVDIFKGVHGRPK